MYKYFFLALLLITTTLFGQQPKTVKLLTPDSEVRDAVVYLQENEAWTEEDRQYIRFFTTYAQKDEVSRQEQALVLSFVCHSLLGVTTKEFQGGGYYPLAKMDEEGIFHPLRRVPGSDTLWWIDLREFNWTESAWEAASKEDGYFAEPIVTHEANSILRLLSGNAVLRSDWFIAHATDLTKQSDVGSKTKIYKELIYGPLEKLPANVKEFETVWNIDTTKAAEIGNIFGTLTTKSKVVSRHNRILFGYETELGWYYRTYDVKFARGLRDYGDSILDFKGGPPTVFDGGEIFATNILKLQVYDLYNEKEELADFADPTIVRHANDILNDVRVRTPIGCMDCHAAGPIPAENTLKELLSERAKAYIKDHTDYLRTKRVYLDGRFEDSIDEHQQLFAKALLKVNGLKTDENVKAYLNVIRNYNNDVDLETAAFECGLTVDMYIAGLTDNNKVKKDKVPFRLAQLIANKESIPREIWEHPGKDGRPGLFQQSMILINGLTKIIEKEEVVEVKQESKFVVLKKQSYVYSNPGANTIIFNQQLKVGEKLEKSNVNNTTKGWVGVQYNGKQGFVREEDIENE